MFEIFSADFYCFTALKIMPNSDIQIILYTCWKYIFFVNSNEMEFFLRILRSSFCVQYIQNKNKISNYTRLMDKLKNRAIFWKAGAVLNLIAANACNFVSERDLTRSKKQWRKSKEN